MIVVVCQEITAGLWLVFFVVWLAAAIGVKRNIARRPWWVGVPVRLTFLVIAIFFLSRWVRGGLPFRPQALQAPLGTILCAVGISYAIWARVVIGRNWGMPMTLKAGHELVTTGPYAQVRHPIYAGTLLAMIGSVLVLSPWWLLILVVNGAQFVYAARKEEKLMLRTFPDEYAAYMRRTWMLIPFVL